MQRRRLIAPLTVVAAVAAGGAAGAVLGVPGLGSAQTSTTPTTTASPAPDKGFHHGPGPELDAAAKALNLTTQQLLDKLSDGKTTIADVAKQQNVDINTVIDAIASADRQRIQDFVNNPLPRFGDGDHDGPGHFFGPRAGGLDAAASAIGITSDQLRAELQGGKSIADVAKAHNVDVNKVIDAMVADASTHIDDAVKSGRLTQSQADQMKSALKDMITRAVNGSLPAPFMGPGGGGRRGWMGPGGDGGGMPPAPQV
ncbi:MAG TPA: hypothetical protein VFR41_06535 [Acidimicrobiia bacterium]|nr:hypothetical protein [Acidimicrobiia bacterium]